MNPLHESINEFKEQLEKGTIRAAYSGLLGYLMHLRAHFDSKYPDHFVSGSLYQGHMDMSYFSFTPQSLRRRKLKIAIVFNYATFRFEAWLGGNNKKVQSEYWELIKKSGWTQYPVAATIKGEDSIVEHVLADNPDFSDLDALTTQIEREVLRFVEDVNEFLVGVG